MRSVTLSAAEARASSSVRFITVRQRPISRAASYGTSLGLCASRTDAGELSTAAATITARRFIPTMLAETPGLLPRRSGVGGCERDDAMRRELAGCAVGL